MMDQVARSGPRDSGICDEDADWAPSRVRVGNLLPSLHHITVSWIPDVAECPRLVEVSDPKIQLAGKVHSFTRQHVLGSFDSES